MHTDIEDGDVDRYVAEIAANERLRAAHDDLADRGIGDGSVPSRCAGLYALVRQYRPDVVVETGVLHGLSTAYILEGLHENGTGELYSVDEPAPTLPSGEDAGWVVPDERRDRWRLTVGTSQEYLEPVLRAVEPVDMFYHDSWHTYPLMRYEFETAAST